MLKRLREKGTSKKRLDESRGEWWWWRGRSTSKSWGHLRKLTRRWSGRLHPAKVSAQREPTTTTVSRTPPLPPPPSPPSPPPPLPPTPRHLRLFRSYWLVAPFFLFALSLSLSYRYLSLGWGNLRSFD